VGLGWNWREAIPCNLLIAHWLSVDYTLLRSSISEKRPSGCDSGASCWDASCAAVVEQPLSLVRVRFRSVFRQLHASVRASYASWCVGRCELCIQQWCGWVMNVHGYGWSGAELCKLLIVHSRSQLVVLAKLVLAKRVHGPVQDKWQSKTRLKVRLCGRSAPRVYSAVRGCASGARGCRFRLQ
jgi:hypothetical protein